MVSNEILSYIIEDIEAEEFCVTECSYGTRKLEELSACQAFGFDINCPVKKTISWLLDDKFQNYKRNDNILEEHNQ